jgi:hypothetical protein
MTDKNTPQRYQWADLTTTWFFQPRARKVMQDTKSETRPLPIYSLPIITVLLNLHV